jgi:hypothetical protein
MSEPIEIVFMDGRTGDSVCLYARWGIYSGEDALFLALKDHKDRWDDMGVLAHSTMRHLYDLIDDGDDTNYSLSSTPGASTDQIHVDFKAGVIRQVTVDYSDEICNQTTVHNAWTFQEFYDLHLQKSGDKLAILHSRYHDLFG